MPLPQFDWAAAVGNRLIAEQRSYDIDEQPQLATEPIQPLNPAQRSSFDAIVNAVETQSGQTFFLHGPGGTGKTTPYATSYVVRGKLFSVSLLQASPLFSSWVAGLLIPLSKSLSKSMNPPPVPFPEIQTWQT